LLVSRWLEQVDIGVAKNASNPGGTVVQLYFSQSAAQAVRPKLMLLAFAKVDRATTDLVRSLTSLPWRFTRHDTSISQSVASDY
jgi:hypothetical protein